MGAELSREVLAYAAVLAIVLVPWLLLVRSMLGGR